MTVGSTGCCGSTELGSGAFRAKRERVGCGSFPDQGTTRTELEAGGGALCGCGMESEEGEGYRGEGGQDVAVAGPRVYTPGGHFKSLGSSSRIFREGLCTGTGKAYVSARSP